jgi:CRP/FNR family cyclic AMP-dependent transcriptional regulator
MSAVQSAVSKERAPMRPGVAVGPPATRPAARRSVVPDAPSAWIEWPDVRWDALCEAGCRDVVFRKGDTLFEQDSPVSHVYVIDEGRVRLMLLAASGDEQHLAIVGGNGLVGECSAFLDGRHSVTAVASSDVKARRVELAQLMRCMEHDAQSRRQVLRLIGIKLRVLAHQNLLLSQGNAAQRVAYHLMQLVQTYGEPLATGQAVIRLVFTHQEMANIAGLSRVMTSNVLAQFHHEGLIAKQASQCMVLDVERLRQRSIGV